MNAKARRQRIIRQLLEQHRVESQEQLQKLLSREGTEATQATLSRDLRDLGVLKGPRGYMLPATEPDPPKPTPVALQEALQNFLTSARQGENIVVLKTGPGQAGALASELDRAQLEGLLGTVAGDDTIFLAANSTRSAKRIYSKLSSLAGV